MGRMGGEAVTAPDKTRVLTDGDPAVLFAPVLQAGGQMPLAVTGQSMEPFLLEGRDTVWLAAVDRPLRRGDIVFFHRPHSGWVLHRVLRLLPDGCVVGGDAQMWTEPVRREWILAVMTARVRDGKPLPVNALRVRMYAAVWRALRPLRPRLLGLYRRLSRRKTNMG